MQDTQVKRVVRENYGNIAKESASCGCECGCSGESNVDQFARSIGYTESELAAIPKEANLGLSCGNPTAIAALKDGETVLDLGSGAGFDCFLAASKVGDTGRVIGVDMTPEMVEKARNNAESSEVTNVEFRLGEIENLPVADNSVDVVISNCVINLSSDKTRVFEEILRVLKPGGRVSISDSALKKELPESIRQDVKAYVGCVAGAITLGSYKELAETSGLIDVKITIKGSSCCVDSNTKNNIGEAVSDNLAENETLDDYVVSAIIEGHKK